MQNASDFKMMDRKAVNSILSMPERNMFFRATSSWVGFKTTYVEFEVRDREAGQSKWSTWSLIKYAFTNIVAFTTAPLQFVTVVGGACFGCSLILIIYSLVQFFCRQSGRGIYNYPYRSFAYWKRYYAQSWNHRLLYCKNIRRSKTASTLYHFPDSSWKRGCLSGGKP